MGVDEILKKILEGWGPAGAIIVLLCFACRFLYLRADQARSETIQAHKDRLEDTNRIATALEKSNAVFLTFAASIEANTRATIAQKEGFDALSRNNAVSAEATSHQFERFKESLDRIERHDEFRDVAK